MPRYNKHRSARQTRLDPSRKSTTSIDNFSSVQTWRMRWVILIAFIIIFIGSLVVIAVTNNSFLVSLPGSLLLFMRPIIRYLYPQERSNGKRPPGGYP